MNRKPSAVAQIISYATLVLMVLFALYPIWFIFLAAVRPGQRLLTLNVTGMFIPTEFTTENFEKMLFELDFPNWLKNSLFVAGMTTFAALSLATSAAFAFSRFRFRGRELGLILFLAIQAFPGVLALVPIAQTLAAIGLYKNHWGLILAYSAGSLVFTTWNLKGYFDTIPIELEEAAMIDGCGPVQSFIRIALPLAKPALAVTALFGFLAGWGDYVLANVVIPAPDSMRTLPVGLYSLANDHAVPWGQFAAGALLISIPVLILFLGLQRFLESGLTLGGVKG
jgi:arabinogalactan oligomer/maltooligosaccharide transport system permease protein